MLEEAPREEETEILGRVRADPELEADVFEELDEDQATRLLGARTDPGISRAVPSGLDGADGAARQYQVPMNSRCRYPRMRETFRLSRVLPGRYAPKTGCYQHISRCVAVSTSRSRPFLTSPPRPGRDSRASTDPTCGQNGHIKYDLER